jgi:hypothetical protein
MRAGSLWPADGGCPFVIQALEGWNSFGLPRFRVSVRLREATTDKQVGCCINIS